MGKVIMNKLVDLLTVKKSTNTALKLLRDYILTALIMLFLCIDWDRTLDNLGL